MAAQRKVTAEMEAEINRLYDSGLSVAQVKFIVHLDDKTIKKYIKNIRRTGRPSVVKSKSVTNFEMIKNMSIVEMAVTILCPNDMGLAEIECDKNDSVNCCKCCLEWLQKDSAI